MTNFAHRPQNGSLNLTYQIEWERKYQEHLREFLTQHYEFDGSAIAAWMRQRGMHDPDHHNLWGAQIPYYAHQGWFTKVGSTIPTGAGHTQTVALWRSAFCKPPKKSVKRAKP